MSRAEVKIGEEVSADVVEVIGSDSILIRFQNGAKMELIRVTNESGHALTSGLRIRLRVTAIQPLQFQFVEDLRTQKRRGHLDVSV